MGHRRGIAVQEFGGFRDVAGDPLGLHHLLPAFGEFVLLTVLRRKFLELFDGGAQIVGLARRAFHLLAVLLQRPLAIAPQTIQPGDLCNFIGQSAEGIEKGTMGVGIDQGAIVVLAMDLDQHLAGLAHQLHADRLVVDIGLGAPVRRLLAAEDQIALVVDAVFTQ